MDIYKDMDLIITNVKIVDANKDEYGIIIIEDGLIVSLDSASGAKGYRIINGKGLTAMPALVDTHAHFREPGFEYKETIETGSKAAVRGGYTTVLLMGNTNPPASSKEIIELVQEKARNIGLVDVIQCATVTSDIRGENISHLTSVLEATKFITDDGKGVMNDKIALDAMMIAKSKDATVISHAENHFFSNTDMRLAENLMTYRDIELARITGCKLHMAHVSTKEAIGRIIESKREGLNLTCEVTPHHLIGDNRIEYRVNPPLREREDVVALIEAIKEGYVDAIGTDHAPHSQEDKEKGAPGISGIETSFSICNTVLVKEHNISMSELSGIMSEKPAKILGIKKGLIKEGYAGDIVLVDEDASYIISSDEFVSKGKNTPFDGLSVYGKVMMTIKAGEVVYKGAEYDSR
ncbi:MAG: Dihydroorotase [Clostridiales bacterium 38_11]|nr:MAG: Dihydroorotase [Clostridiales bacterium 38_11]